ncbi:hypothetical protein G7Y79_00016g040750 [Physcia stellaris]|nr:hypothetical protein G7Y79_00016g040750 [Physcia stellaris]
MAVKKSSNIVVSALLASIAPLVSSTPLANSPEDLAARGLSTCAVVSDILKVLNKPTISASATKFCSSFISIPLRTSTTVSTTTLTPAPVTTTTVVTVSTTTVVTSTLGLPVTTPPAAKEKRGGSLPVYVSAYASSKISAACSCLSITPATTTVKTTSTVTAPALTATVTSTTTSTSTSTSTVLGVASQCLPAAISASPVSLIQPGLEGIAGTAEQVRSGFPINNVQDCCSACYLATSSCVAFTYGNLDNEQVTFPPVLDNPSTVNTCRICCESKPEPDWD